MEQTIPIRKLSSFTIAPFFWPYIVVLMASGATNCEVGFLIIVVLGPWVVRGRERGFR
jgi:hypothetical protein